MRFVLWLAREINQAPFFQKRMNSDYCVRIAGQVAPTGCSRQVHARIHSIQLNHEVAVLLVDIGILPLIE